MFLQGVAGVRLRELPGRLGGLLIRQNFVDLLFVQGVSVVVVKQFVGRPFLSENLEPIDRGQVSQGAILRVQVRVCFQKHVAERGAEVSAIDVQVLLPRNVDFLALGAESFDAGCRELFREPDWEHKLAVTQDPLAITKSSKSVLLTHHCESTRRENESCVC